MAKPATRAVVGSGTGEPVGQETAPRFTNRTRTLAVTFGALGLTVETTDYEGWSRSFQPLLRASLEAFEEYGEPTGVERMGLRYIDELRIPSGGAAPEDWRPYLAASVQPPLPAPALGDVSVDIWQGLVAYRTGEDQRLVLRYGYRQGSVLDNASLRRMKTDEGPFFLLDTDSFWEPANEIPAFRAIELAKRAEALHAPVTALFESLITDRLREEVLNVE